MMIDQIKNGSIILCYNPFKWTQPITYLSAIIRLLAQTKWNHCAIVVKLGSIYYVVEATFPKVKITLYDAWIIAYKREIEIINIQHGYSEKELKDRIMKHVNKKYDLTALAIHLPIFLLTRRWYGRREGKGIDKPYCYELVAWIYQLPNWFQILPNEFIEYIKNPKKQTI